MTFSIDNPEGGCINPPLGKYVWEKPSGKQGLNNTSGWVIRLLHLKSPVEYRGKVYRRGE